MADDLSHSKAWSATVFTSTMKGDLSQRMILPTHIGLGVFSKELSHMQMNQWLLVVILQVHQGRRRLVMEMMEDVVLRNDSATRPLRSFMQSTTGFSHGRVAPSTV